MEILIYIIIFIIGAFIGSFASLATYRIPIKEDILIKHSYCPVCKEKLVLKDLIPIFSYIFLRGRCSHCGEKIKPRYIILESVSGLLFLLFILSFNIDFANIGLQELVFLLFLTIFFVTLVIIAGIDKENKKIDNSVILFDIALIAIYNIFLFYLELNGFYAFTIVLMAVLFYAVNFYVIKGKKKNYLINFLILMLLSKVIANCYIILFALVLTIITSVLHKVFAKSEPPMACYYIIYFASIFIGCNFII